MSSRIEYEYREWLIDLAVEICSDHGSYRELFEYEITRDHRTYEEVTGIPIREYHS